MPSASSQEKLKRKPESMDRIAEGVCPRLMLPMWLYLGEKLQNLYIVKLSTARSACIKALSDKKETCSETIGTSKQCFDVCAYVSCLNESNRQLVEALRSMLYERSS